MSNRCKSQWLRVFLALWLFIWKGFQVLVLLCSDPFCRWCSFEDSVCQSLFDATEFTAWINHCVCLDASKLDRLDRVVDFIVELLVACYIVDRFFIMAFSAVVSIWLTFICGGFIVWTWDLLGFLHFLAKFPIIQRALHFFPFAAQN